MWNKDFYEEYYEHLNEPRVRKVHDEMFSFFEGLYYLDGDAYPRVIDFGGGTGEYGRFGRWDAYWTIDKNETIEGYPHLIADFMSKDFRLELQHSENGFISIFASEIIQNTENKYKWYQKLFKEYPSFKYGMVSGFYYKGHEDEETIEEKSGHVVFQSIEDQRSYICPEFIEFRCYKEVPNKMWGPDLVEVWKFFKRNI